MSIEAVYLREVMRAYLETWNALSQQKKLLFVLAMLSGCASAPDMSRETSLAIVKLAKAKN